MQETSPVDPKVNPQPTPPDGCSRERRRKAAPGLYLTRSGFSYVFQMRVPKEVCEGKLVVRIGLGAMPHREARRLADMLAAQARLLFDEARQDRMRRSARSGEGAKAELIISSESRIKLINEIRSNLKSYLRQVIPTFSECDSRGGFPAADESESLLQTGGLRWDQRFR